MVSQKMVTCHLAPCFRWNMNYIRGPDCGPEGTFGRDWDTAIHDWGKKDLFPMCCTDKMACYNDDSKVWGLYSSQTV